ncbi:MAG: coagulation factor 5/8 type domain protein, partial [Paenibacillus sp.]|nr:coagulation factor 5/8 type domain protein [Paenibacillus sp.]
WYIYEAGNTVTAAKTIRDKTNLALRKPVGASVRSGIADRAVDGDLNSYWQGNKKGQDWLQIDLGASKQFNRVVMKWGSEYASRYKIQASDDGASFTDIYVQEAGDGGTDDIAFGAAFHKRYLRIVVDNESPGHGAILREVELYHEAANLAGRKTVSASTQAGVASQAADENLSTKWTSDPGEAHWLKIDLGNATEFNKVVLDWEYGKHAENYRILVSNDDIMYTAATPLSESKGGTEDVTFAAVSGKYVKVEFANPTKPADVSLFEIRVYNDVNPIEVATREYTVRLSGTVMNGAMLKLGPEALIGTADVYVPVQAIADAIGWTLVRVDGSQTMTLTQGDRTIELTIGSASMIVDGETVNLAAPTAIRDQKPAMSLRGLAEAVGLQMDWNEDTFTVLVRANPDQGKTNLALNKSVTLSNPGSTNPAVVTDGIKSVTQSVYTWKVMAGQSMRMDLGERLDLNTVKVYEMNFQRLRGYTLEYSQDGTNWTVVKDAPASELLSPDTEASKHYSGTIRFDQVNARYIRLTVKAIDASAGTNPGYIEEIEVYNRPPGEGDDESGGNLAFRRQAFTDFSFGSGDVGITKVVDGDVVTRLAASPAKNETEGFIMIDLEAPAHFTKLVIYEELLRIQKYRVLVSMDQSDWKAVAAGEGIGQQKEILFAPVTARYIKVELSDAVPGIRVKEIQVFNESGLVTYPFGKPPALRPIPVLPVPQTVASVTYSKEDFHIYLFIGQSNMNGRDLIPYEDRVVVDRAYLLNAGDRWEYAQPYPLGSKSDVQGFNRYSSVDTGTFNGMNPALSFSRAVTESVYGVNVGIVSNARGGTSVSQWQKGSGEQLYEEAVRRTIEAMRHGTLKAIFWLQGEGDANTANYLEKVNNIASGIRNELGVSAADVPFIASQNPPGYDINNERIQHISEFVANSDWISSVGTSTIDGTHFDGMSERILGIRYAVKALASIYNSNIDENTLLDMIYGNEAGGQHH